MSLMYEDAARQPDQEPACEIGDQDMPPGHETHHWHVNLNFEVCSCGKTFSGPWSVVITPDSPSREWLESRRCSICGARDVVAAADYWAASA